MSWETLSNTCHNGPCPTAHRENTTGDVKVQGYVTTADELNVPAGEDIVFIPADAWARLLADLPVSMLLKALVAPWRFRPTSQRSTAPAVEAR